MAQPRLLAGGPFPPLALGLVALSWITLLGGEASSYGRYLHHGDWTALGLGAICTVVPGLLYAGGWLLMSMAMMLPTALPLIRLFDRMIVARPDRSALHALLISGYMLAWAGFGVMAHLLDLALHAGLGGWRWLVLYPWIPGAVVLAGPGAFQFSALKYHCLDKCRTPLGFMMNHWHGPHPARESFTLGLAHGAYCVGCCWALMLLMFVVGTGSLGWMFLLGLVMALEKNHPWGRHLAAPLGGGLLAAAGLVVLHGLA